MHRTEGQLVLLHKEEQYEEGYHYAAYIAFLDSHFGRRMGHAFLPPALAETLLK